MSRLFRPIRALLAESLAIGLLVVLFALPSGNVERNHHDATTTASPPARTEAPVPPAWRPTARELSNEPFTSAAVQEQLGHAASAAGVVVQRELDRILAPLSRHARPPINNRRATPP